MKILLVGCGRMGSALARIWCERHEVLVYDPLSDAIPDGTHRLRMLADLGGNIVPVVVLAVKPQVFSEVAPQLAELARKDALFISLMAGVSRTRISAALGGRGRVVRTMPNTPAAIGRGITAAIAGPDAVQEELDAVEALLSAAGELVWLEDEPTIDLVTAMSGSGPAYFFRFAEAVARAGVEQGLDPALAMRLARATFTGSAALAEDGVEALAELRRQVASPGGTTAAGLARFEQDEALDRLVRDVVEAAAARARQLAG